MSANGTDVGGLIGYNHANYARIVVDQVANSYWDTTASGIDVSDAGTGFADLSMPTASATTASGAFYQWSSNDWDFGTNEEYPALKDSAGHILPQQLMQELSNITVGGGLTLVPAFNPNVFDYYVEVNSNLSQVSLTITASDSNATMLFDLEPSPTPTNIVIFRGYRVRVIHPLDINIIADSTDIQITEGQSLSLAIRDNIADAVPLSYMWTQTMPNTPLLMEGIDSGITIQGPNFNIPIPGDLVLPSETELPITLSVLVTGNINGSPKTQSVRLTVAKVDNGIGSVALAVPDFVGNTPILQSPNIAEAIAADPDGEAADADKNIQYQWQSAPLGETVWTDIANASDASLDLSEHDLTGHLQYRLRMQYTDAQGYDNIISSAATMPIVDKDRDGLIEMYYLEDLNAIRYNLSGSTYKSASEAPALTGGCPNTTCRGYELRRDLDFNDAASYASGRVNSDWTVSDFSDNSDRGWMPIGIEPGSIREFSGILDGNGHTLFNLQSNIANITYCGLFGILVSATIRDINLFNVKIDSSNNTGVLSGSTRNSYFIGISVNGEISAFSDLGGLVGTADESQIINSHAHISLEGGFNKGGLIGSSQGSNLIINSYATVTIKESSRAGGLIGLSRSDRIINSYADVDISIMADAGGLIGALLSSTVIINSYVAGSVTGTGNNVGGLIGNVNSTVNEIRNSYSIADLSQSSDSIFGLAAPGSKVIASYWDTIAGGQPSSGAGIGKTTVQMQVGTAQSETPGGVYYNWSEDNWDFGTATQYPVPKYAPHPDPDGTPTCDAEGLPRCGAPIISALRYGLKDLSLVGAELSPPFIGGNYTGNGEVADSAVEVIRLLPTAFEADARIDIYDADGKTLLEANLASGTPSQEFAFSVALPMRRFVLEVKGTETVRQSIRLNRVAFIDINDLDDLNAIRDNLTGKYRLARDLNFLDDDSYSDPSNRPSWTVDDFNDSSDSGWTPIADFEGIFDGNNHTIANLQFNRDDDSNVALFASALASAMIYDIGLLDVAIEGGFHTGSLVGTNEGGEIRNSFVTGQVTRKSNNNFGGLVGNNKGKITDSFSAANVTGGSGLNIGSLVGINQQSGVIINCSANGNVSGSQRTGGLVGQNTAQVINSNAAGSVTVTGNEVGGLVGSNRTVGSRIINSYATGAVSGNRWVGGLTGSNDGKVINSYATGNVTGRGASVGGLVASNDQSSGEIRNSYATGTVSTSGSRDRLGGLVGYMIDDSKVINSYAIGNVPGASGGGIGALIGWHENGSDSSAVARDVTHSYWDSSTAGQSRSSGGSGQTTAQLQSPTAATGIYSQWSTADWHFGTASQYPILKYAPNAGGEQSCDGEGLPDCGNVISPGLHHGMLTSAGIMVEAVDATLNPAFDNSEGEYIGIISESGPSRDNKIQLRITAPSTTATITVYVGSDEVPLGNDFVSGGTSEEITLVDGNNPISLEISALASALPFRYKLNLRFRTQPFIEIKCLDELNAIRNNLSRNYSLTRDLDFDDENSYCDPSNKANWTVDDFDDATDTGWEPIGKPQDTACLGCFTGNFDGNGHTISNLQINRDRDLPAADHLGLFGSTKGGSIGNLGLVNVKLEGRDTMGGLAGSNEGGRLYNSHVTGSIEGRDAIGGLVGYYESGKLYNSHVTGSVKGSGLVGGLVGSSTSTSIVNSYARILISTITTNTATIGGLVGSSRGTGAIINSHANVRATGFRIGGGLVGSIDHTIVNVYATGALSGTFYVGGHIGLLNVSSISFFPGYDAVKISYSDDPSEGSILQSILAWAASGAILRRTHENVWNTDIGQIGLIGRRGTTAQLQSGTAQSIDPDRIYHRWSNNDWDFGTASQYPILKYTDATDTLGFAACGTANTPPCGSLISPEVRNKSVGLTLVGKASLVPPFDDTKQEYFGSVINYSGNIQLIVTTTDVSDNITVHRGATQLGNAFASGTPSPEIILGEDAIQTIVVKVTPQNPQIAASEYTLYLKLQANEIDSLEDLSAIRDNPAQHYRLTRHLDFNDPASYASGEVNEAWRVDNFDDAIDIGWEPIPNFSGEFDGNGHTIANLQINRTADNQGLFDTIAAAGVVRGLGLLNAEIEAGDNIGALAANNAGTVIGSYAIGKISGRDNVGGLVGTNPGSVFNSYAIGTANNHNGTGGSIGGLIGSSGGAVANSYANVAIVGFGDSNAGSGSLIGRTLPSNSIDNSYTLGSVSNANATRGLFIGGLVGSLGGGRVSNSYANAYLDNDDCDIFPRGGLIGQQIMQPGINLSNNYAIGTACAFIARSEELNPDSDSGTGAINAVTHTANYWDLNRSGSTLAVAYDANTENSDIRNISRSVEGKTTAALQSGSAQSAVPTNAYYRWSEDNWDFGTASQYPILKYRANPDGSGLPICDGKGLPDCGTLISPQIRDALQDLILADDVVLSPPFGADQRDLSGSYFAVVPPGVDSIRLIPTAHESDAMINIYIGTVTGKNSPDQRIASDESSAPIALHDGINRIVLELVGTQTVQYPLYIQSQALPDEDGNGFVEIDNLEELNAIRDNIANNNVVYGNYELSRHLDFNDPASYAAGMVNEDWTVANFSDDADTGWLPINFGGTFNGNGYAIANLQINRDVNDQGLFGTIVEGGMVRDLGLLNAEIEASDNAGALAGINAGTVIGSYASGELRGNNEVGGLIGESRSGVVMNSRANVLIRASGNDIGGLVGRNRTADAMIINSHASGAISGNQWVGSLIGSNGGKIINSYANGTVSGQGASIGGLAGDNSNASSEVRNSYATGSVSSDGMPRRARLGSLLGYVANNARVINSYAIGTVTGAAGRDIGALIGLHPSNADDIARDVTDSYWNSETVGQSRSSGGSGQTTAQLRMPTAVDGIYANWSAADWDFGTALQYPILKYAPNPDRSGVPSCDGDGLPDCGTLISRQIRYGLRNLSLADTDELSPAFSEDASEYYGLAITEDTAIRLIPTAKEHDAMINIYIGTSQGKDSPDQRIASGATSAAIELGSGITSIVLEIVGTQTVRYPLYIQYRDAADRDGDGLAEIDNLEELNAIRDNPSGNYELARHLDFNDPQSYAAGIINKDWTVDNFHDRADNGWLPISNFSGTFNGNGYTIANLRINRSTNHLGLFGTIDSSGIVRDLGLFVRYSELRAIRFFGVGALAGTNAGTVIGSYAVGEIHFQGAVDVGGLIGESRGLVINSHANVSLDSLNTGCGGLVGRNTGMILNSYASGVISGTTHRGGLVGENSGKIINSYATGNVRSDSVRTGGLVGFNDAASSEIKNSYATGIVRSTGAPFSNPIRLGGLVGEMVNNSKVINSYAIGTVVDTNDTLVGALIGNHTGNANDINRDVTNSYWNSETAGQPVSAGGSGQTTAQLQSPTAASGIYENWSAADWDFGSSSQYPLLKYAPNLDPAGESSCDGNGLPNCSDLIAPQLRYGLSMLTVAGDDQLFPPFRTELAYAGSVSSTDTAIRLIATALDANAEITMYIDDGNTESQIGNAFASGNPSPEIVMDKDRINIIVVEVDPSDAAAPTVRHTLYLQHVKPTIDSLEDLDNIRNHPGSEYRLTRNLDFADDASYDDAAANKAAYTVDDFDDDSDRGWQPIGHTRFVFTGIFNGNGHTISNLQINQDATDQGLFSVIGNDGIVRDLGLLNVKIEVAMEAGNNTGALAGDNNGTVIGSYATGEIRGTQGVGGLIGLSGGSVINSYADVLVRASRHGSGGLVGRSPRGIIINSHASGAISAQRNGGGLVGRNSGNIINSYATANVTIDGGNRGGGLVGWHLNFGFGMIRNNYATGIVSGTSGVDRLGGLVGEVRDTAAVINSYAIGTVTDATGSSIGALIGNHTGNANDINRDVTDSYWNSETAEQSVSDGGSGQTTAQLQSPTTATGIYMNWSAADWDFGSSSQYPVLKYVQNPDSAGEPSCDGEGLPVCGTPIARTALISLDLVRGQLKPGFDLRYHDYRGIVESYSRTIQLHAVAAQQNAQITFFNGNEQIGSRMTAGSGVSSPDITPSGHDMTHISIEVISPGSEGMPGSVDRYKLSFRYKQFIDRDGEPYIAINGLEGLDEIRNNLSGTYILTRHLDFNDPNSYASGEVNTDWTTGAGWVPIGSVDSFFVGTFDGNGYTISNLRINRPDRERQALFAGLGVMTEPALFGTVRDLGLLNVKITGRNNVGALLGENKGTVIGCFASGEIVGINSVGGLIGYSSGNDEDRAAVINSYAEVVVNSVREGEEISEGAGGLIGKSHKSKIFNSYAGGIINGDVYTGGLIGWLESYSEGIIKNNYAVNYNEGEDFAGGLIGRFVAEGQFSDNYASGSVVSDNAIGGLIGIAGVGSAIRNSYASGAVRSRISALSVGGLIGLGSRGALVGNSYSNGTENPNLKIDGGTNSVIDIINASTRTTAEMQAGRGQSTDSSEIYYQWSEDNWDFGTTEQYPLLKYAQSTGTGVARACDGNSLPDCGELIAPQIRFGLQNLSLAGDIELSPPFGEYHRNIAGSYFGSAFFEDNAIRLVPTAKESSAMINIYIGTVKGKDSPDQSITSGGTSAPIALADGSNRIVLEIVGTQTVQYPLYIQRNLADRDGNGFVEIDNLDELDAIRNDLSGKYELTRDLDFLNDADYFDPANKASYTVDDFFDISDSGWVPIGNASLPFVGEFNGNGYTISNLQIDRDLDNQGLFGVNDGIVRDIGLLSVRIIVINDNIGALAGTNSGTVMASYAIGLINGISHVGALVGSNISPGSILNSYAAGHVRGSIAGGLAGMSSGFIINSHTNVRIIVIRSTVGGMVGTCRGCVIRNSFAVGSLLGVPRGTRLGGFIGYLEAAAGSRIAIANNYAFGGINRGSSGGFFGGIDLSMSDGDIEISSNYSIGMTAGHFSSSDITTQTTIIPQTMVHRIIGIRIAAVLPA